MKKLILRLLFVVLAITLNTGAQAADRADQPYDEAANSSAQVTQAFATAKAQGKRVLIVFGANWCGDCRMLDAEFKKPAMQSLLDANFVTVKVNVGRFDKNLEVVKPYGDVIKKGIPSIVVATADRQLVYATSGGELADARGMGEDWIAAFFQDLAKKKAGP